MTYLMFLEYVLVCDGTYLVTFDVTFESKRSRQAYGGDTKLTDQGFHATVEVAAAATTLPNAQATQRGPLSLSCF